MNNGIAAKPERRVGRRNMVTGAVNAQIALDENCEKIIYFRLVDISSRGLGIWTQEPLPFGSTVFLKAHPDTDRLIPMKVRWCKENYHNTQYYRCGLELDTDDVDLGKLWSDLNIDQNTNQFTETMVMALLGTVARDIAHDINNSAQAIHLNLDVLRQKAKDRTAVSYTDIQTYLDSIQHNAVWIGRVVNTMRSFTSPTDAEQFAKVSIDQVLEDVELLSSNRFRYSAVKLEITSSLRDEHIFGRKSSIVRAVLNLTINAYDAVPKSAGSWVRIDAIDLGDYVEIGVANTGEPMTAEKWAKIVAPHFTTKPSGNSGLGLDITSRILVEHHGALNFDDSADHCRITITLPKWKLEQ